jgi:hypothetical protein
MSKGYEERQRNKKTSKGARMSPSTRLKCLVGLMAFMGRVVQLIPQNYF